MERARELVVEPRDKAEVVRWAHHPSPPLSSPLLSPAARWAWDRVHLPHLRRGSVLPRAFHSALAALLAAPATLPQAAEALLYSSLLPSLAPCLATLHTLLTAPALDLDTAVLTAKTLANLRDHEWRQLRLAEVLPGLGLLAAGLVEESPEDVAKFYSSLPEVKGLQVPELPPAPAPAEQVAVERLVGEGRWTELPRRFLATAPCEVEQLAGFVEVLVEVVERVAENGQLAIGLPQLLLHFVTAVEERSTSEVHLLLTRQLGLALFTLLCRAAAWHEAAEVVALLAGRLATDFLATRLPAVGIFLGVRPEVVPLLVLETLVRSGAPQGRLVEWLEGWSYLEQQEEEEEGVRARTMLLVLARLLEGEGEVGLVAASVRVADLLTTSMAAETAPLVRRRHELLVNNVSLSLKWLLVWMVLMVPQVLRRMLNLASEGPALWARWQAAEACRHSLSPEVARGLVFGLAHARLLPEATAVYRAAVSRGVYMRQAAAARPLKLLLHTGLTMEEMAVIVLAFLARLDAKAPGSLTVFLHLHESSAADTAAVASIKHLASVPTRKEDGLERVARVLGELEPPLVVARAGVPCVQDRLVRRFLEAQAM